MKSILTGLLVVALLVGVRSNGYASQATTYIILEYNTQQQTGTSSFVGGYAPFGYEQFDFGPQVDTQGASLSAAPTVTLPAATTVYPSGSITFTTGPNFAPNYPTGSGYDRYQFTTGGWTTSASLNSAFGSGTFTYHLGNATATPTLTLNTASPVFPVQPTLTSGGTWVGGTLMINPAVSTTLNFNASAFTTYTSGEGGQISYRLLNATNNPVGTPAKSQYIPAIGKNDPALTSYTIPAGTLTPDNTYSIQVDYEQVVYENETSFTGTGISGSPPLGASIYSASTIITLTTPGVSSPTMPPWALFLLAILLLGVGLRELPKKQMS